MPIHAALAALLFASLEVASGVQVSEQVQQYEVRGSTREEVARDLSRRGPTDEQGRRFHALTKWQISWLHRQADDGRQCRVTSVQTYLEVTTTLPKWLPGPSPQPGLAAAWNRYVKALTAHERGHKRMGIEAAQEIQRRFSRLPAAPDCAILNDAMQQTAKGVLAEYELRSQRYDQLTGHGASQGATFP